MYHGSVALVSYVPGETGPALLKTADRYFSTCLDLLTSWLSDYPCIAWPLFLLGFWLIVTLLGTSICLLFRRVVLGPDPHRACRTSSPPTDCSDEKGPEEREHGGIA